jgi:hypothetical protein
MAAVSVYMSYGAGESALGQTGANPVTFGTSAPAGGDIEIRVSSTAIGSNGTGITLQMLKQHLDILWRSLDASQIQGGGTSIWPNL